MSEGISTPSGEGERLPEAGGLPPQTVPSQKKFFLLEYLDEVRRGIAWLRAAPKPEEAVIQRVSAGFRKWAKGRKARIGGVVVVLIIFASYSLFAAQAGSTPVYQGGGPGTGPGGGAINATVPLSGSVTESSQTTLNATLNSTRIAGMTVTLTWTDESYGGLRTNQPDSLGFDVVAPNGKNWSAPMSANPVGQPGRVTWQLTETNLDYGGTSWSFIVKGGTMGDCTRPTGLPCFAQGPDTSNAFSLTVAYSY